MMDEQEMGSRLLCQGQDLAGKYIAHRPGLVLLDRSKGSRQNVEHDQIRRELL